MSDIEKLKRAIASNPSDAAYLELAKLLEITKESRIEAREICFRALNKNPADLAGRLQLARLFYLDGLSNFCLRELHEIKMHAPKNESLDRLLAAFGQRQADQTKDNVEAASENEKVVAELDLDIELADIIAEFDLDDD